MSFDELCLRALFVEWMFFSGKAKVQHKMHSTGFHRPCHFEHWELRGSLIQWIALLVLVSGKPGELFLTQARWQDCLNHLKSQSPIKLRRKIPTGMRESAGERYKFNVQICKPRQIRPGALEWIIQLGHFTRLRRGLPPWKAAGSTVQSRVDKFFRCWWHLQGAMALKMGTEGDAFSISIRLRLKKNQSTLWTCWFVDDWTKHLLLMDDGVDSVEQSFLIHWGHGCQYSNARSLSFLALPSGKHTKNYGKIHHF